jgi:hypothetical protein
LEALRFLFLMFAVSGASGRRAGDLPGDDDARLRAKQNLLLTRRKMLDEGDVLTLGGRETMRKLELTTEVAMDTLTRASMRRR